MNEIHAVVRRLGDGCVWVETDPAASCSRCKGGNACSTVSISRLFCSPSRLFCVASDELLQEGDLVRLGMREDKVVHAALLGYGLPMLGLASGATLGFLFAPTGEWVSIVAGFAGFGTGLWAVRHAGFNMPAPALLGKVSGPIIPLVPH